ncbi:sensor histidine kinase [Natrarchaeobius halalkaliphilus]|uniref:histidine kinase n=1 Tax=Natrarchaeobius halalkaliphilus TaxID=1679091 RepID=A0A3N6P174_9EURY|nr:ATP-binding protein [Natrarchaeobius halalkaliphilus]RQG88805.1 sensor histidine kinase [Natrarchaeobius halalkaliphilus]
MKLTYRFGFVFLLVVFVTVAGLVVTFDAHRSDVVDGADRSLSERADRSASTLDDRIREHQRTVAFAASNPNLAAHGTDRQADTLEQFVELSAFDGASIVDETGQIRAIESTAADDPSDVTGSDLSDRQYVASALAGETSVSDPVSAETGAEIVVISAPIRDGDDVVGSLNGAYYIEDAAPFDSLVTDERSAVTVETNEETVFTDADRLEDPIDERAELETVDWTVVVHRERSVVTSPVDRLVESYVLLAVALLGSVFVFGIWMYRSNVTRIGRFRKRIRAIERREYGSDTPIGGHAEWQRIDDALDGLADSLARREQMLFVLNRILRHNLRNTLTVVTGRADELESTLEGEDREAAAEIATAARELLDDAERARMTEALVDPVDTQECRADVATMVRDRVDRLVRTGESERNDSRSISVFGPQRAIAACGTEVSIAIDELLENAVEHAGPEPSVAVEIVSTSDRVRIRIEDDGPGIPADDVAVITGKRELSQVNHTGGIGLWLVDWIVSRYDGRLLIPASGTTAADDEELPESDESEGGGTVVLELPRPPAETSADR